MGGAIHGLTRWAPWNVVERDDTHASFQHVLYPCQGWEWILDCRIDNELDDTGLTVRTSAMNVGDAACPYGTGAHPYLTVGTPTINAATAIVPGSTYLPVNDLGIPTGDEPVDGTIYDLRSGPEIGDRQIDVTYTDLTRGQDGRATAMLSAPSGDAVSLWANEAYPFFEIFTGEALPQPDRRRRTTTKRDELLLYRARLSCERAARSRGAWSRTGTPSARSRLTTNATNYSARGRFLFSVW